MAEKTKTKPAKAYAASAKKAAKAEESGGFAAEIITILVGVLGIFIMVSLWFNSAGLVGKYLNLGVKGLFGAAAYVLPLALVGAAICHFAAKDDMKSTYIAILFLLICTFVHYVYIVDSADYISGGRIWLWKIGTAGEGGGIIGGTLAEILVGLFGEIITAVLTIALAMIDIILLFRISVLTVLGKFFRFIGRSIKECFTSAYETDDGDDAAPIKKEKKSKKDKAELPAWEETPDITIASEADKEEEISINDPLGALTEKSDDLPLDLNADSEEESYSEEEAKKAAAEIVSKIEENIDKPVREYVFPSTSLLDPPAPNTKLEKMDKLKENAAKLLTILESFGIDAKITNVTRGSSVTRYEIVPAAGVKVNKITALDQDIAMRLPAENVRIEVLPGSIGIEASNESVSAVYIRDVIESKEFNSHPSKIAVALGRDINGKVVVVDIAKMPHLLIAGTTGSGKSVCINAMITSLLYKATPEEVRLVMVDPKAVELEMYNGIPHLLVPIVTDARKAAGALCWAVNEMEERYKRFSENSVRNLAGFNAKMKSQGEETLPQIVIIIDELADLMMVAPGEVQDYILRLAQKARAAGMHLVLATQRPSVDVITGLIKANIPSRFSFQVSNHVDSRTILDVGGAEKLVGKGDMLMMLGGSSKLVRVQGAFVSDGDVERVTNFIKENCDAEYNSEIQESIEQNSVKSKSDSKEKPQAKSDEFDELLDEAVDIAFELDQISTSMLQRRLKIGYARAGRLIDLMDKLQIISPYDGSNKPRTLRMTREQYYAMREEMGESEASED